MAPGRRKGSSRSAAVAASRQQWKVGDLVLAKMKGFPAWPAEVSEPERWGYSSDRKKLLVLFYGTKQIAFCNYADIEAFTEEKKKSLLTKRQGKGADFVRAVDEIVDAYQKQKMQNSGDEGTLSSAGNSEGSRTKCFDRSPELSSDITNSHQSELHALPENHELLNSEEIPATSMGVDIQDAATEVNEPTVTISILDQLRRTSLVNGINSRKRLRDAPVQNFSTQRRVQLVRRSRSSSGHDLYKFQRSAMKEEVIEDCTLKEEVIEDVPHISSSSNIIVRPDAAGLPFNGAVDDILPEISLLESEAVNLNGGNMLVSGCEVEYSGKGCSEVDRSNEDFRLNISCSFDLPLKAAAFKKRRNQNRKPVTCTTDSAKLNLEAEKQVQLGGSLSESHNSLTETNERSHSVDGDEHLPLVKRARVRMNKLPVDETQVNDKYIASPSLKKTSPDRTAPSVKESLVSLPINNCTVSSGNSLMFWKTTKYQLKGSALDVEAALPPSKRLHRALEAMSANTAEATKSFDECIDPPKISPLHLSTDQMLERLAETESMQPSDNVEVPLVTSSDSKPDLAITENFRKFSDKDYSGNLVGGKDCDESSIFTEKQETATSSEGTSDALPSGESMPDQILSPLRKDITNQKVKPTKKYLDSRVGNIGEDQTARLSMQNGSVSNSEDRDVLFLPNEGTTVLSSRIAGSMTTNSLGVTKSTNSSSNDNGGDRDMQDIAKEFKSETTPKDQGASPDLTPMKDLIAAAQAKRLLSRSTSFYDKDDESSGQGSPENSIICNTHTPDDSTNHLQVGGRNPNGALRQKGLDRFSCHAEAANGARKAFEAVLCTLSRTKESIGRATRLAISCAKYGIAGEVIEMLLHNIERESSLFRRVDLFFLVDSITQCSRSQKGGAGDVYPSLVQSVLSRLLSAAAPSGNAAWENRRQCLKVLRVWLERKTLPEAIVRHHMRELECANEASFTSSYSRRPSRTERALNDPVREMEGMLVDEYGSNTSFQLPSFLHPHIFENEDVSSDDDKSFEAVTPERNVELVEDEGTTQVSTEKHRLVLEDVDGELEMEDLAPPCEVEVRGIADDALGNSHYLLDHHRMVAYAPPLPEDKPPSPPPLPSSPPPSSCSTPVSLISSATNPSNLDPNLMSSGLVPYVTSGYGEFPPDSRLTSSSSYKNPLGSNPGTHNGEKNSAQPLVTVPLPTNKAYHLHPPPRTVSNQFSYVQTEPPPPQQQQQTHQSWGNSSSVPDRFQYVCDNQRGSYYGDRGTRGPIQHEMTSSRSRLPLAVPMGLALCDKIEPSESSTLPCRGWSLPPRPSSSSSSSSSSSYSIPASRASLQSPISRVAGAPAYWRPR